MQKKKSQNINVDQKTAELLPLKYINDCIENVLDANIYLSISDRLFLE